MDAVRPKPIHFTYAMPTGDLQQGDVIERKKLESEGAIAEFAALPTNAAFMVVLTQSCDLVGSHIKTDYIALAPAVPLKAIVGKKIAESQTLEIAQRAGVCGQNKRSKLVEFLAKLLNNNDPQHFYLHKEHQFSLEEPMCTLLRTPAILRAESYYSRLINTRVLALSEEFRAKLGWMVGSIYGRIATQDWPKKDALAMIDSILTDACGWEDHERLRIADRKLKSGESVPTEKAALNEFIRNIDIPTKQEQILNRVRDALTQIDLSDKDKSEIAKELCDTLEADAVFKQYTMR